MIERETAGVQALPPERGGRPPDRLGRPLALPARPAVERVAEQWPTLVGEVRADLVGAAGEQLDVEPRRTVRPGQDREARQRALSFAHPRGEALAIHRMPAVGSVQLSPIGRGAVDEGAVPLLDVSRL